MPVSTCPYVLARPPAAVNLLDASQDSKLVRPRESALLANWDMRHFRAAGLMKGEVAWHSDGAAAATAAAVAVTAAGPRLSTFLGRPSVFGQPPAHEDQTRHLFGIVDPIIFTQAFSATSPLVTRMRLAVPQ
ncbi:hypothetical protein G7Z17_g7781 [Cylindrodendrum hubeiense]|uniref:Uncharacterized protein n=1 Tax=Cylindrodendrum hubeiense TaxID=595255 RepID=A0A9P5H379_9HYPO|nr:hypothetical protein G7Z17_g7781 [Cylindrodendrum hubeiense]